MQYSKEQQLKIKEIFRNFIDNWNGYNNEKADYIENNDGFTAYITVDNKIRYTFNFDFINDCYTIRAYYIFIDEQGQVQYDKENYELNNTNPDNIVQFSIRNTIQELLQTEIFDYIYKCGFIELKNYITSI